MSRYSKNWMEVWFFIMLAIGLIIAVSAPSAVTGYIIVTLSGTAAGRLVYRRKDDIQFPYLVIILGFFIGYVVGSYYGSRLLTAFLFIAGFVLGYKLFEKQLIKDVRMSKLF